MIGLLCFVLAVLASPFKSKLRLEAENAVLRHQLVVLRRKLRGRVQFANSNRWFFVQLCALAHVRREARSGLGDRGGGVAIDAKGQSIGRLSARLGQPNRDVYFAGDQRHYGFGVVAFWAFESPRIETRSFRLDDPQ